MLSWICAYAFAASVIPACEAVPRAETAVEAAEAPAAVVKTVELKPAEVARRIDGTASFLNPDTLIQLDADIRNATIALDFSKRQYERFSHTPTLPKLTVEGAEKQLGTDTTQLNLLNARLRHTFGETAPFLASEPRKDLVAALSAGTHALARLDFPQAIVATPEKIRITALGGGSEATVEKLWLASSGNLAMPGISYFAILETAPGLRPGDRANVVAETDQRSGVVIPNASIVVSEGQTWAYVETEPQKFERRPVSLEFPVEAGYLAQAGFTPGMRIVVNGASTLLAREAEPVEDDDGGDGGAKPKERPKPPIAKKDDDETPPPTSPANALAPPAHAAPARAARADNDD